MQADGVMDTALMKAAATVPAKPVRHLQLVKEKDDD
jgi:hypothetical protein